MSKIYIKKKEKLFIATNIIVIHTIKEFVVTVLLHLGYTMLFNNIKHSLLVIKAGSVSPERYWSSPRYLELCEDFNMMTEYVIT